MVNESTIAALIAPALLLAAAAPNNSAQVPSPDEDGSSLCPVTASWGAPTANRGGVLVEPAPGSGVYLPEGMCSLAELRALKERGVHVYTGETVEGSSDLLWSPAGAGDLQDWQCDRSVDSEYCLVLYGNYLRWIPEWDASRPALALGGGAR